MEPKEGKVLRRNENILFILLEFSFLLYHEVNIRECFNDSDVEPSQVRKSHPWMLVLTSLLTCRLLLMTVGLSNIHVMLPKFSSVIVPQDDLFQFVAWWISNGKNFLYHSHHSEEAIVREQLNWSCTQNSFPAVWKILA